VQEEQNNSKIEQKIRKPMSDITYNQEIVIRALILQKPLQQATQGCVDLMILILK